MLKKREEKLAPKPVKGLNEEDKKIQRQNKNMKREKRRENVKTEEEFDSIYKAYEK